MRTSLFRRALFGGSLALASTVAAQGTPTGNPFAALHWRMIGPVRGGRARAIAGVASRPNTFYIGFDNGGVWRTTDYGSTWQPLFDDQPTGSIGAIAVAPSDPNVLYVGSGAGIIRPDLATGDGMYKSTDAGRTWTHLGLRETQMIAQVDVDPRDPNRVFVAALGHPYGPNAERGIFRSTDGGRTFEKVLYKDEYTSGNDVRIDPSDPNTIYATLWQQQQSFIEGQGFGGPGTGIYKSTDGGTTWKQLSEGLPNVIQANLTLSPSNSKILYATVSGTRPGQPATPTGTVGFYKSTDGGEHWQQVGRDPRPLARIGGGDLPTVTVDPKNENVVYSASTVMWRTEDGGQTWSAVRGAPGGDDYQRVWVNPTNTDIVAAVADQGAVVSANRGLSWSNWYNQPTAAMYHVSTSLGFPYLVCGGQQDSGSACVTTRSMYGEIPFGEWFPVQIQEYGIAAPDPADPNVIFGSARTNVSRFDRRTGQTSQVGPDLTVRGPNGEAYNRNVRTMPILFSPIDHATMYYAQNVVYKSADRGHSWTRISPDLARQTWTVPPTTGKYASGVTVAPLGSITALSASPRSAGVLWAGTDDGNIQVTTNGGATWSNVTPPQIAAWTRIFNIDAGHFDTQTAYAAANTMRVDDMNPHLWRTHDGGRTWTTINTGIAPGAVTNSIREDPRTKGLLYASTDTQVWVSFDDGDHWESLRLDMPAISVRDLQVKDDSACLCSDLIAATHGRGFYILDDLTPLRQMAAARATGTYLFKPATAVRVRFGANEPTPWPPELPAGESAPPGGIVDYALGADAQRVTVEILDGAGTVVRTYASTDPKLPVDPAFDPAAYDKICQRTPSATYCGLPLYWPAPQQVISTRAGLHRIAWDLHFDQVVAEDPIDAGDEDAKGAVPHRTFDLPNSPWAPPGTYTVRLTIDGKSLTQPLTLRLDPRVKTTPAALTQIATLSRDLYDREKTVHAAYLEARAMADRPENAALKAQLDSIAPPATGRGGRGFGGFRGGAAAAPTLSGVTTALNAAAMAMQNADVAPTASQITAAERAKAQMMDVMKRWAALKAKGAR